MAVIDLAERRRELDREAQPPVRARLHAFLALMLPRPAWAGRW